MCIWKHRNQTTPRKDEQGEYRRCLDCGKRIPWSWDQCEKCEGEGLEQAIEDRLTYIQEMNGF